MISGSHNLRDLGGYSTDDGRQVRSGLLFRSGFMNPLREDDRIALRKLGIAVIFDLRANDERARRPIDWHEGHPIAYHSRDYEMSVGVVDHLIRGANVSRERLVEAMHEAYRELPFEQAASYRELFRLLSERQVPLLFNCTAGKDRTGIAAALILYALGVPRETIEHDYALTEREIDGLIAMFVGDPRYARLARLPREDFLPLLRADPEYLSVAFGEIERRHGSVEGYLETVLEMGPRQVVALRDLLLQ